jgi:hypothetical protein
MEQLAGTKFAVEAGALEQEIGAAAGPSHLLGFVHAAVDQEVGGAFGDRRADPQTGTMAFGMVPSDLAPKYVKTTMADISWMWRSHYIWWAGARPDRTHWRYTS